MDRERDMQDSSIDVVDDQFDYDHHYVFSQDVLDVAEAILAPIYTFTKRPMDTLKYYLHLMVNRFFSIYGKLPDVEKDQEELMRVMEGRAFKDEHFVIYAILKRALPTRDVKAELSDVVSMLERMQEIVNDVMQKNAAILHKRKLLLMAITSLTIGSRTGPSKIRKYSTTPDRFIRSILLCVKNYHGRTETPVKGVSRELVSVLESIHQRVLKLETAALYDH